MTTPPWPLIEIAVEPRRESERDGLLVALKAAAAEDPRLGFSADAESGQIMLKGADERHLESKVETLRRTFGMVLHRGTLQVAYRETIRQRVEQDYTFKRQSGGIGQFARLKMIVEPSDGNQFLSKVAGGAVPDDFMPGVEKGIADVMRAGILAGYPLLDVTVTLVDGAHHDTDSSAATFEIAARAAFRQALHDGGPLLLEPIMTVEVTTPEAYVGAVTDDLKSRRGTVLAPETAGRDLTLRARVPLANLIGYGEQLRSFSQGDASFTMRFMGYEPAPSPEDGGQPPPAVAAALRA